VTELLPPSDPAKEADRLQRVFQVLTRSPSLSPLSQVEHVQGVHAQPFSLFLSQLRPYLLQASLIVLTHLDRVVVAPLRPRKPLSRLDPSEKGVFESVRTENLVEVNAMQALLVNDFFRPPFLPNLVLCGLDDDPRRSHVHDLESRGHFRSMTPLGQIGQPQLSTFVDQLIFLARAPLDDSEERSCRQLLLYFTPQSILIETPLYNSNF